MKPIKKPETAKEMTPEEAQEAVQRMGMYRESILTMFSEDGADVNEAVAACMLAAVALVRDKGGTRKRYLNDAKAAWDNTAHMKSEVH